MSKQLLSSKKKRRRRRVPQYDDLDRHHRVEDRYVYADGELYYEPIIDGVIRANPELKPENLAKRRVKKAHVKLAETFVKEALTNGCATLVQHFRQNRLGPKDKEKLTTIAYTKYSANHSIPNRFKGIECWDQTRVVLKDWRTDYIHANYVAGHENPHKFICTLDPQKDTQIDFWYMVMQEKTKVIVMLRNLRQEKPYYPMQKDEEVKIGIVTVTAKNVKTADLRHGTFTKFVETELEIKIEGKGSHTCTHLHWNEHANDPLSQPPELKLIVIDLTPFKLYEFLNTYSSKPDDPPIVIHCVDGVSRTGCFVLIATLLEQLMFKIPWEKNLVGYLDRLRLQRCKFVASEKEYLYVHMILLNYVYRYCVDHFKAPISTKEWKEKYEKMKQEYMKIPQ